MNEFLPKRFVEHERRRTFMPDGSFARRVVRQIQPVNQAAGAVWDFVPSFARPTIAVMTLVVLVMLGVQVFLPGPPEVGLVDFYLEMEHGPSDQWMYGEAELPQGSDLLVEISLSD